MRKSTSFKIVNCMAPESRVLVLGRASIDYIEKICIKSSKKILLWSWKLPIKIYSNEKKECLFQKLWFHGPCVSFYSVRAWLWWFYSENAIIVPKSSPMIPGNKPINLSNGLEKCLSQNCEFHCRCVRASGVKTGLYW